MLEDNLRTPSGVSYVLENRMVTKRVFQHAMERAGVRRVDEYPDAARRGAALGVAGRSRAGDDRSCSRPGPFNSAYFEHSFLARSMGLELVEATDLFVTATRSSCAPRAGRGASTSSTAAPTTPSSIPSSSAPDSLLGVPGLMRAYAAGKVALANAPGNGVADDKAIYAFVPDLIRFFLGEEPILAAGPDLRLRRAPIASTCSSTWASWWSRRSTRPAATAC